MTNDTGGGQCGALRVRVEATVQGAETCNRRRGQRLGAVFVFAPRPGFLPVAGEGAMPDGREIPAINKNTRDGVDRRAVAATARHRDGRSM